MTQHHPIVPPPEAMERLCTQAGKTWQDRIELAYQAGADAELEACCECLRQDIGKWASRKLRTARRPKLLSSKELALKELEQLRRDAKSMGMGFDAPAIRRALQSIPDEQ